MLRRTIGSRFPLTANPLFEGGTVKKDNYEDAQEEAQEVEIVMVASLMMMHGQSVGPLGFQDVKWQDI